MTHSFLPRFAIASMLAIMSSSCSQDSNTNGSENKSHAIAIVELLEHSEGGLTVAESVTIDRTGQDFTLASTNLHVLEQWTNAEAIRETNNNNKEEAHAVELTWEKPSAGAETDANTGESPGEKTKLETTWIYEAAGEGPAGHLPGLGVQVRVLPPGARPSRLDQWKEEPKETVHFLREGRFYPVPAVGGEPFPRWVVKSIRTYEHALVREGGEIEESTDTDFINRCIEIDIASSDGTIERHVCFIDHPQLTQGIHPAFLPVSRLTGVAASNSRLAARDLISVPKAQYHRLLLSPNPDTVGKLGVYSWNYRDGSIESFEVSSLPAEVKIGNASINLVQHRNRAQSVVKWQKAVAPDPMGEKEGDQMPALLVMWLEGHSHKKTVLPLDRPTPVRINGDFQILRYRAFQ